MPPRCLRFALQVRSFDHYLALVELHNFSLLSQNCLRRNRFASPLPFSPSRLVPGGILVHSHVSGVTNPSCLCSRMWEALDHLCSFSWRGTWPQSSRCLCFIRNQSSTPLAHWDPALRTSLCLSVTLEMSGDTPSGDKQRRVQHKISVCGAAPAADHPHPHSGV